MDMLLAFRGVHGGAANAARTTGIAAYFYDIAVVLVLIFLVIVFLAILGLCVELFRSWRTDSSEQGRQSGRILLIILVVLSGMSYVDYNYTNLLGGLCKEAVKARKGKGPHVNYDNVITIGKYQVHDLPKVKWQFRFVEDLRSICAALDRAEPANIPELRQRLNVIKDRLRAAYGRDKSLPEETEALFRKLREDIARKYPEEVVLEAQAAQRRAQEAEHARWERAEAYRPVLDEIEAGRKERGGAYTKEEVDRIVSIQREVGWDEGFIQWDIDAIREAGHLPEGYQIPPKDVPPAAEAAPPAYLSPNTTLLGGAELTGDAIRKMDDAALGAHVNSLRPRAQDKTNPLNDAETFAVSEQRRRFLAAGNKKAAEELERTFRLPPRDHAAPANGQPNINGGNSPEKITITPEEAGVTNGGEISIR